VLSRVNGLRVAARSSVFALKGKQLDARIIGDTLGVTTLLGGSVRRSGERLRVRVELVNVRDGYTIWSETYERELSDVFAVQDDIARSILTRLQLNEASTTNTADARKATSVEAYDIYLKGRFLWNRRTEDAVRRSVDFFKASIAKDSSFALAHAALGDAYSVLGNNHFMSSAEALPKAKIAAQEALRLDSRLAEAHAALGWFFFAHDRDWAKAEAEFRLAISLNPSYPSAHHWYALQLSVLSRHDEAIAEMTRALQLDPLSPLMGTILGTQYLFAGRTSEALRQLQQTRDVHPSYPMTLFWLGQTYQHAGDSASAITEARNAVLSDSTNPRMLLGLSRTYAATGHHAEARRIAADVRTRFGGRFSPVQMAWVHASLGENAAAIQWLERAYAQRDSWLNNLAVDPALASLKSEAAVRKLRERLRL
jgi:tetratricopeptide (TPR) repeat protein